MPRYATFILTLVLATLVNVAPAAAQAGQRAHSAGEYTVHYNAIPTTALSADVARHYGINRSGNRGLVNIAVLRQRPDDAEATAVTARIQGLSHSLVGQRNAIELREIRDQDAIYYIGEFRIRGEERLRFEFDVRPDGHDRPIQVRFENHFIGR